MTVKASIQPADPAARRRALLFVVCMAVAGSLLIYGLTRHTPEVTEWLRQHLDVALRYPSIGAGIGLMMMAPMLAAAIYLFTFSQKIIKARRLPPPGQSVVRDTVIREGADAVWRARILRLLACLLVLAVAVFPLWCWQLLRTLAAAA